MKKITDSGLTLMEILIAGSLSVILVVGILRLYVSTAKSYNTQDLISEMNQNANYTCKRLSDEIMQAGAYLPDSGVTIIEVGAIRKDSILIRTNPFNASQEFVIDTTTNKIPVDKGALFRGITDLWKVDRLNKLTSLKINSSYNATPFSQGVNTSVTPNQILLTSNTTIIHGDVIFAQRTCKYYLKGGNFCLDTDLNVLAENIDSLAIVFFTKTKTVTTSWKTMHYATIFVRSKVAVPDPKYVHPIKKDHYRRYSQSMEVLIRKKTNF